MVKGKDGENQSYFMKNEHKKNPGKCGFSGVFELLSCEFASDQRLENCGARRAAFRPYFLRSHDRNHCICKGFGDYKGKIVPSIVPSFRNRLFLYYRLGMLNA